MAETHFSGPIASYRTTPGYEPGVYYTAPATVVSTAGYSNGSFRMLPFVLHQAVIFDRIAFELMAIGADNAAVLHLGIYSNSSDDEPDRLLLDCGTVVAGQTNGPGNGAAPTGVIAVTINLRLDAGTYWIGMGPQQSPGTSPT